MWSNWGRIANQARHLIWRNQTLRFSWDSEPRQDGEWSSHGQHADRLRRKSRASIRKMNAASYTRIQATTFRREPPSFHSHFADFSISRSLAASSCSASRSLATSQRDDVTPRRFIANSTNCVRFVANVAQISNENRINIKSAKLAPSHPNASLPNEQMKARQTMARAQVALG